MACSAQLVILLLIGGAVASELKFVPGMNDTFMRREENLPSVRSLTSISSRGFILVEPSLYSDSSEQLMRERPHRVAPENVMQHKTQQYGLNSFVPEDRWAQMADIVRTHMRPHSAWALLAKDLFQLQYHDEMTERKVKHADEMSLLGKESAVPASGDSGGHHFDLSGHVGSEQFQLWSGYFMFTMGCLALMFHRFGQDFQLNNEPEDDCGQARGTPCWSPCLVVTVVALSWCMFHSTLVALTTTNTLNIQLPDKPGFVLVPNTTAHPTTPLGTAGNEGIEVPAGNAGERAYETGFGIAFSAVFVCLIVLKKRFHDKVQISTSLLSFFSFRGATLATTLSAITELVAFALVGAIMGQSKQAIKGSDMCNKPDVEQMGVQVLVVAVAMFCVGVAEETAKALAVIWGMWICARTLRTAAPASCCSCRVLVESPRALMLAGLASGCGLMVIENMEYLFMTAMIRDTTIAHDAGEYTLKVLRWGAMFVRTVLNIHPWMVGITCARLGRVIFGQKDVPVATTSSDSSSDAREPLVAAADPSPVSMEEHAQRRDEKPGGGITPGELIWALYPSVLAHAFFDFSLMVLGVLAIWVPFVGWWVAKAYFEQEWEAAGSSKEEELTKNMAADALAALPAEDAAKKLDGGAASSSEPSPAGELAEKLDEAEKKEQDPYDPARPS